MGKNSELMLQTTIAAGIKSPADFAQQALGTGQNFSIMAVMAITALHLAFCNINKTIINATQFMLDSRIYASFKVMLSLECFCSFCNIINTGYSVFKSTHSGF